jgi:superfamily II helicase
MRVVVLMSFFLVISRMGVNSFKANTKSWSRCSSTLLSSRAISSTDVSAREQSGRSVGQKARLASLLGKTGVRRLSRVRGDQQAVADAEKIITNPDTELIKKKPKISIKAKPTRNDESRESVYQKPVEMLEDVDVDVDEGPKTAEVTITNTGASLLTTESRFQDLEVSEKTKKAISKVMKYEFMTPVQAQAIPEVLKGNDVFVKAKTGTGKTLGFLIPAIEVSLLLGAAGH